MSSQHGIRISNRRLLGALAAACAFAMIAGAAQASWTAPADLSSGSFDYDVSAAINANGDAAAVWFRSEPDGYHSEIEASARDAHGSFGAPLRIDSGQWLSTDPGVVISKSGEAVAVFSQETGSAIYNTWAAVRSPGGSWSSPVQINDQSTGLSNNYNQGVAMDGAGDAFAFWYQNTQDELYWTLRPAGGTFGAPQAIANPAAHLQSPDYAAGGNGDAVVTWGDYGTVYAAIRRAGHGFGSGVALNSTNDARDAPSVAMDGQGNALAAWMACTDPCSSPKMEYAWRPAGGSFGPPQTLAVGTMEAYIPVVAMSQRGDAVVAWGGGATDPSFEGAGITAMIRPAGGQFGPPEDIDRYGSYDNPRLAWDEAGRLFAAWRRYEGPNNAGRALGAVRPPGGHFTGDEHPLSDTDKNVWPPAVAAAGTAQAIAAWPIGYFNGNYSTFWIQEATWLSSVSPPPDQPPPDQPPPPPPDQPPVSPNGSETAPGPAPAQTQTDPLSPVAAVAPVLASPAQPSRFRTALNVAPDLDPVDVRRHGLSFAVSCSQPCRISAEVVRAVRRRHAPPRQTGRGLAAADHRLRDSGTASFHLRLPISVLRAALRRSPVDLLVEADVRCGKTRRMLRAPVVLDRGVPLGDLLGRGR